MKQINQAIVDYIFALNEAIYHGKSTQSEEWFCKLIKSSIFLIKTKFLTFYLDQIESEYRY